MEPNYTAPGPDTLACPACETHFLGAPAVPLQVLQLRVVEVLQLGDAPLHLNGQLTSQLELLLAQGDYDLEATLAIAMSGHVQCPVCGHHSDWQLQRPETDLLYSRYRVQALEPDHAPNNGLHLMGQGLVAARDLSLNLKEDTGMRDLSSTHSLEQLFEVLAHHALTQLATQPIPQPTARYYAHQLLSLPTQN